MTKFVKEHKNLIQAIMFWVLLVFMIGFCSGLVASKFVWNYKVAEVTKTGAVLIDNTVYEVKRRI